jgi:hypothetical protein
MGDKTVMGEKVCPPILRVAGSNKLNLLSCLGESVRTQQTYGNNRTVFKPWPFVDN